MSTAVKIEGMSDCLNWCDKAPEDMIKLAKKAMYAACGSLAKGVKTKIDPRWRGLVRYKVSGGRNDKDLEAWIGLFNGHQQNGKQPAEGATFDWFKAYWKNYGTLTHRDPSHEFSRKIKPSTYSAAKRRRNNVGQPHENFFEAAMQGFEDLVFRKYSETIAKNIEDCYDR